MCAVTYKYTFAHRLHLPPSSKMWPVTFSLQSTVCIRRQISYTFDDFNTQLFYLIRRSSYIESNILPHQSSGIITPISNLSTPWSSRWSVVKYCTAMSAGRTGSATAVGVR